MALINIVTQYKLNKVSKNRFTHQIIMWLLILLLLIGSYPFYNILTNQPILGSAELSVLDIVQTTAIILLFYIVNNYRQRLDQQEKRTRDLHQELSIKLSNDGKD